MLTELEILVVILQDLIPTWRAPSIEDEVNHNGAEQESLSKQERSMQMKITFILKKWKLYACPMV